MRQIIVYTCITNDYDVLMPPRCMPENVQFICFTDNPDLRAKGWEVQPLRSPEAITKPDLINRYHKFFPNQVLPETEISIYVDGSIKIIGDVRELVERYGCDKSSLILVKHSIRDTIQQEAERCILRELFTSEQLEALDNQLSFYTEEGMPARTPLTENCVIIRCHQDPIVFEVMELWWQQLERFTSRDQLSLPYCVWKIGLKTKLITDWNLRSANPYFKWLKHKEQGWKGRVQSFSLKNDHLTWLYVGLTDLIRLKNRTKRRIRKFKEQAERIFNSRYF